MRSVLRACFSSVDAHRGAIGLPNAAMLSTLALAASLGGCLADNPPPADTDDTSADDATDAADTTETGTNPGADNMLGCAGTDGCWVVIASQSLDDRVEVFGGPVGATPSYRGAISMDLKPGTEIGPLDEPFGATLSDAGLHVVTGHYPATERGSLLTFPTAFFDQRDAALIDVGEYFEGGVFSSGVLHTAFDQVEPIFVVPQTVQGRVLVSVFGNDLFEAEDTWTVPGQLAIVDPSDPSSFALRELNGLDGGDCLGASQLVLLGDDRTAAVACDGNEAVAFLDLGDLSGSPQDGAANISGKLCNLPFSDNRRARYIAPDGAGGVLLALGPTPLNATTSSIYSVSSECGLIPVPVADSDAQLGEITRFGDNHWLLARGALSPAGERGVVVIDNAGACGTVGGLDNAWANEGQVLSPYALTVAPGAEQLLIGAGPSQVSSPQQSIFGKVLWAELQGTDDPCTMTATATDLTDGGAGHAPAPSLNDTNTWRQAPSVVVLAEVGL